MPTDGKPKKIHFEVQAGIWSFEPDYPSCILEFDSYAQLVAHCLHAYGQEIEFHEVTPENWQSLYDSGAFER